LNFVFADSVFFVNIIDFGCFLSVNEQMWNVIGLLFIDNQYLEFRDFQEQKFYLSVTRNKIQFLGICSLYLNVVVNFHEAHDHDRLLIT